jgi:hypothetical protein
LSFTQGDAATAFGKIDLYVSGTRDKSGTWQISVTGNDKYDFAFQNYKNPVVGTINNTAYFGQNAGAVSNFTTNLNFIQSIPLSQQTFKTPSGAVVTGGGKLVSGPPAQNKKK